MYKVICGKKNHVGGSCGRREEGQRRPGINLRRLNIITDRNRTDRNGKATAMQLNFRETKTKTKDYIFFIYSG